VLGALAGSFALPGLLAWLAAAPQCAFYLLAALDPHVPERWRLKRFSALARTFVVLMLATLCAARVFFVPAERIWKPTTKVRAVGAGNAL